MNESIELNVVPPEDLEDVPGWLEEIATALSQAEMIAVKLVTDGAPVMETMSGTTSGTIDPCPTKYTMLMFMGPCPGRTIKDPFEFEFTRVNPDPEVPPEEGGSGGGGSA